jgi:Tol biopolymer transport system component
MTEERIDALIRRLDAASSPDPAFVTSTFAILRPRVRAARVQDLSRFARLRGYLRAAKQVTPRPSLPRPLVILGAIVLVVLAALAAAVAIGGPARNAIPSVNGPLIVAVGGDLRAIDPAAGTSRPIGPPGAGAEHVSRSPDGGLVAYWNSTPDGDRLMVVGLESRAPRRLAPELSIRWNGCADTWSPDSRYIAAGVIVAGERRILVGDTVTGSGRLVTPEGTLAHCPLWSPAGTWIAFTEETATSRTLDVIRSDGSGMRVISGQLGGSDVSAPDTWSPDGRWVYFDAISGDSGRVYRSDVDKGSSVPLTTDYRYAVAPASSPDGTRVAFIVIRADLAGFDLYVSESDGSHPRLLLEHAVNNGWSADGRYVLTRWTPTDQAGGLALITPDGSELRVVAPLDQGCPADTTQPCDVGWGQPRP